MKFKFTISLLLLLFLLIKICSSVKVDHDQEDSDASDLESDYEESSKTSDKDVKEDQKIAVTEGKKKEAKEESAGNEDGNHNDGEKEEDDEDELSSKGSINTTSLPFAVEGESLRRLQQFVLNGVETAIKSSLPMIIRSTSETNVSAQCSASFLTLISALRESKLWAFKMLDASGKLPSGVLEGTLADLGSFDQCLELDQQAAASYGLEFTGQYCLLDTRPAFDQNIPLGSHPPPGIQSTDLLWDHSLQLFWATNHLLSFRYGACIPSSCSREDFEQLVNFLLEPVGMESTIHSCQFDHQQPLDVVQIGISITLAIILVLVMTGTFAEYVYLMKGKSVDCFEGERSVRHFITRFSLQRNTQKLLESTANLSGSPLRCLDGMRTISISWIILGHTYFYTDIIHYHHYRRIKQLYLVDDHPALMWLSNFTFSVDTFFHISGVLLIYSSWKKLKASQGKIDIFDFFVHRVWRIWPAYLATIGMAIILPLIGSGPLWPLSVESTAGMCRNSWLYNILFINNFQRADEICLLHTWFLAASMQFHVLGGIVLFIMYKNPKAGIALCAVGTLVSSVLSFSFSFRNQLQTPSVIAYEVFAHDADQKILQIYMMPYNHFGSYLSGVIIGYFLVRHADRKIPKVVQVFLWTFSSLVAITSLCGPFKAFQANFPSVMETSLYYAFARTAWSWSIGWIIFACGTGRGGPVTSFLSWSFFNPLSNLSFLAYLVHPILMLFHTGRIRERIYFAHYELVNIWVSRLVFSFLLAYFVHVMVEVPFASIEGYIFRTRKKEKSSNDSKKSSTSGSKILDQARLPSLASWSRTVPVSTDNLQPFHVCCSCCVADCCKRRKRRSGGGGGGSSSSSQHHLFTARTDSRDPCIVTSRHAVTAGRYTKTDSADSAS